MRGLLVAVCLLGPLAAQAAPLVPVEDRDRRPQLRSIYCEEHRLEDLADEAARAIVFVFLDNDCPVAQQYIPTLNKMRDQFGPRQVRFVGIYPNARVHVLKMAQHAHDQDIAFPVFLDPGHRLADLLEIEVTPEVVVLDGQWNKKYQGAIDNQYKRRGRLREASEHYLADALTAVLAGKDVTPPHNAPSGCPLERLEPPAPQENLTYYRDVAPLIQKNCQTCHRDGGVGPFELVTYDDAYYSAERIREAVVDRRMPPWHGFLNPKFGRLVNDKRLDDREIQIIDDWARTGAAKGDPADAPAPIQWPDPAAWEIGTPDFVYKIPEFHVPKHGILDYQFFRVRMNYPEDRWFRAVEVKPGDAEVVHHVGLHVVPAGEKLFTGFTGMAELYGMSSEGGVLINDYVPGDTYNAKVYPKDRAVRIAAGSDLIFELHYTPNNREARVDQSKVAFQWADAPPQEEVLTTVFRKPIGRFRIPPHDQHRRMEDTYYFRNDVLVDAVRPHFHLRAKSFRLEIIRRDEVTDEIVQRETVLSVPIWDPDWQRTYELETPLRVLAGTELLATGVFDNSAYNPNNPDPTATVEWGQQTTDEMFSTRFKYRVIPKQQQ